MLMTRWQVSIHAPAWGATVADDIDRVVQKVSIHAPAWGATQSRQGCYPIYPSFNPRARVGRDAHATKFIESLEEFQSTRPRGARLKSGDALEILEQFQSTRPRGATNSGQVHQRALDSFNPRARVGRDRPTKSFVDLLNSFNPRARVGRDPWIGSRW